MNEATLPDLPEPFGEMSYRRSGGNWGRLEGYTTSQMRAYARAALSDRAVLAGKQHVALGTTPAALPEQTNDVQKSIADGFRLHGYRQGTGACIAFHHGINYARINNLPAPPARVAEVEQMPAAIIRRGKILAMFGFDLEANDGELLYVGRAEVEPARAHYIYIPAQQHGYVVEDLDEATDDLTNYECEVTPLYAGRQDDVNAPLAAQIQSADLVHQAQLPAILPAPVGGQWRPIETAPRAFSPPISTTNHHAPDILGLWGQAFYCVCSWGGPSAPYWIGGGNKRVPFQPTRWMPLPGAPTPPTVASGQPAAMRPDGADNQSDVGGSA